MIIIKDFRTTKCQVRLLTISVWLFSSGAAHHRLQGAGLGWSVLEPLTWVDTTSVFLLQVTQHLCTQLRFSFWLAEHLWVGNGTV